jgi:hypothetical protein
MYLREDATPYYVGKGVESRPFFAFRTVPKPKEKSRILIQFWSSEAEAFEMEKFYIRLFGRKDSGTGILRNRTDGGEGSTGYKHTVEALEKLSRPRPYLKERNKIIKPGLGVKHPELTEYLRLHPEIRSKPRSAEARKNMSAARQGNSNALGKHWKLSQKTRDRMSAAQLLRKEKERHSLAIM